MKTLKTAFKRMLFILSLPIFLFFCFIWVCLYPLFWIIDWHEKYMKSLDLIFDNYFSLTEK